jgi:hypothetical protein
MDDHARRRLDLWAMVIALATIVVTMILTYGVEVLVHLRGSSLAYLAWLLLAASVVCGLFALRVPRSRVLVVLRNITLVLGLVLVGCAVALNAYAGRMFKGWPGA